MEIHVYHHILWASDAIDAKLDAILTKLTESEAREIIMAGELDALEAKVTAITEVIPSVVELLTGLKAKLDEAIAALPSPDRLNALSATLGKDTQDLADAVAAGTSAA